MAEMTPRHFMFTGTSLPALLPQLSTMPLPDGVYVRLDPAHYFEQDRLGSTDLMTMAKRREGWWWRSRYNPRRAPDESDARNYGSALHAIMLEGLHAYDTRFCVAPDKRNYPGLLETTDDIKEALAKEGFSLDGTSSWKKPRWIDEATALIPHRPCWDAIMADFRETKGERAAVTAEENEMLRLMLDIAMEDEECRKLLSFAEDTPTLSEVSVLWHDELGTPRRARFDKPVPQFTLDLKSLGNWQGRDLAYSIGDLILRERYDVQVADQHAARTVAFQMINADPDRYLVGGTDEERAWLRAMAARAPWMPNGFQWDWAWMFYQKPDPSGIAPVIFPLREEWRGPFHLSGFRAAHRAVRFFHDRLARFGLGDIPALDGSDSRPWSRVEELHYTTEDYQPHIVLPLQGWTEQAKPGSDEHDAEVAL